MKAFLISLGLAVSLLVVGNFLPDSRLRLSFVGNAEAIIGLPWTPLSFAGVARRSMYRQAVWNAAAMDAATANAAAANYAAANAAAAQAAAANAAAANAAAAAAAQRASSALPIGSTVPYLPPNFNSTVINGANLFNCGGVYYKAGFQANHIVYIVTAP